MNTSENTYLQSLEAARAEMTALEAEERRLFIRKAQIKRTITALTLLCFDDSTGINGMTLSNAIRTAISSAGKALSAIQIRIKLEELGFDLSPYKNPLASIHTAMQRMTENEELILTKEGNKKLASPGENFKSPDLGEELSDFVFPQRKSLIEAIEEDKK
jgi:hypothetical protein